MSRKRAMVLLGIAISLVFLFLAFRGQNWGEIGRAFGQADFRWFLPAAALILADYGFRAWRWGMILRPALRRPLPLTVLAPVLLLGFAANNVLPARAGEVWRVWGLARRTEVRKSLALSTLVVERVFDGFTLLGFLALAGLARPLTGQARYVEGFAFGLFGAVFVGLLALLFFEPWTLRVAARLMWPLPDAPRARLLDMVGRFTDGLRALHQPRALLGIVGSSILAWGCQAASWAVLLYAFGFRPTLMDGFAAAILLLALVNLLIMIPAGPGNVGTFEAAGLLALTVAGLAGVREQATALVLATHALQWLTVTGVGLLLATREGLSLARLGGAELPET